MRARLLFLILFATAACGEGTRLYTGERNFFSQENPFIPIIQILGDNPLIIEINTAYVDPGAKAESLRYGDLSAQIVVENHVDVTKTGQYQVVYKIRDAENRESSAVRFVLVVDTSRPFIQFGSLGVSPSNDGSERTLIISGNSVTHYKAIHRFGEDCEGLDFDGVEEREIGEAFRFTPFQGNNVLCGIGKSSSGKWQTEISKSSVLFVDSIPPVVEIDNANLGESPSYSLATRMVDILDSEADAVQYKALSVQGTTCSGVNFDSVPAKNINEPFEMNVEFGLNVICAIGIDRLGNVQVTPSISSVLEIRTTSILIDLQRDSPTRDNSPVSAVLSGEGVDFYKAVHRTSNNCNAVNFNGVEEKAIGEAFVFNPAEGDNIVCAIGRNANAEYSHNPADVGSAYLFVDSVVPLVHINSSGLGPSPSNNLDTRIIQIGSPHQDVTHYKAKVFENISNCNNVNLSDAPERSIGEDFIFTPQAADSTLGNRNYIICAKARDSVGYDGPTAASSILIIDTVDPIIEINGQAMLDMNLCAEYEEAGAVIRDLRDGVYQNIGNAQISGVVDTLIPDTYEMTYTGKDQAGNDAAPQIRKVVVNGNLNGTNYNKAINSREGLEQIKTELSWNYYLCGNIDLENMSFEPIGSEENPFEGVFEGNHYTIKGLNIEDHRDNLGFFGVIGEEGVVRNLQFEEVNVSGRRQIGALAGRNLGSIENVHVLWGTIGASNGSGGKYKHGGLVGENQGWIEASSSAAFVSGEASFGGLVGSNRPSGVIRESYSSGTIIADASDREVGGLVGKNEASLLQHGLIEKSFSSANILGSGNASRLGGLVGANHGRILNSYAEGSVSGKDRVGGLVGELTSSDGSVPSIENSYALGFGGVTGQSNVGGLVGYNSVEDSVWSSYWNVELSGLGDPMNPPSASLFGVPLTDAQMKLQESFVDWDFISIWDIEETLTYPYLRWEVQ